MKRIIAWLLVACLIFTLSPLALADTGSSTINAATWDEVTAAISNATEDTVINLTSDVTTSDAVAFTLNSEYKITITTKNGSKLTFGTKKDITVTSTLELRDITVVGGASSNRCFSLKANGILNLYDVQYETQSTNQTNAGFFYLNDATAVVNVYGLKSNGAENSFWLSKGNVNIYPMGDIIIPAIKMAAGFINTEDYKMKIIPQRGYMIETATLGTEDIKDSLSGEYLVTKVSTMPSLSITVSEASSETYSVMINSMDNGDVTANPDYAVAGDTVTLTVVSSKDYQLSADTLIVTGGVSGDRVAVMKQTDGTYTFTMPDESVTVTAEFEPGSGETTYPVTINSLTNGTITATPSSASKGDNVTLTVTSSDGYQLKADSLTVTGAGSGAIAVTKQDDGTYTFTMPDEAVSIAAEFEKGVLWNVTVTDHANGSIQTSYAATDDGLTADVTVTAKANEGYSLALLEYSYDKIAWYALPFVYDAGGTTATASYTASKSASFVRGVFIDPNDSNDNRVVHISTERQLRDFATAVNGGTSYEDQVIWLDNDINLTGQWTPIGIDYTRSFQGAFFGNGHSISGLDISVDPTELDTTINQYLGLFGYIKGDACVRDLTIDGAIDIPLAKGPETNGIYVYTGSIAAYAFQSYEDNLKIPAIIGCTSLVNINAPYAYAGGIVGGISGSVYRCANYGEITTGTIGLSDAPMGFACAGGICAEFSGTMEACVNYGNISVSSARKNLYDVSGNFLYNSDYPNNTVGGLIGGSSNNVYLENCYNSGQIIHTGDNDKYTRVNVAGLVGAMMNNKTTLGLTNCYNAGSVSKLVSASNTVISDYANPFSPAYVFTLNNTNSYGPTDIAELGGLTAAKMGSAYQEDTNRINGGYPLLAWESASVGADEYAVTFKTTPSEATVRVFTDSAHTDEVAAENGSFHLTRGSYYYTVSADGYVTENGSFNVVIAPKTITVALRETATVTFTVKPANAEFSLTAGSTVVMPDSASEGVYTFTLYAGDSYEYTAEADGYSSVTREFEAADGDSIAVTLTKSGQGQPGSGTVTPGKNYTINAGGTYDLPKGSYKSIVTISTKEPVTLVGSGVGKNSACRDLYIDYTVSGAALTLEDVYISNTAGASDPNMTNMIDFTGKGNALDFSGTSILDQDTGASGYAMIHVNSSTSLTVTGGTAYFYKRDQGAGIGGNGGAKGSEGQEPEYNGNISIDGATLFMKSSKQGALIGSGADASSTKYKPGSVSINDSNLNLITISRGAAIGGAAGPSGGASGANVTVENSTVSVNVDWSGAAIGGGGNDSGNDAKGGTLNYESGSIRTYICTNAVGMWDVDSAGVNGNKAITAAVKSGGNMAYLLTFDTSKLSRKASTFDVMDGSAQIYSGGLHKYRYVNEGREKGSQMDVNYTMDNWAKLSDSNLYLYLTGEDHTLTVNGEAFTAKWDKDSKGFTVSGGAIGGAAGSAGISEPVAKATIDVEAAMSGTKGTATVTESDVSTAIKSALEAADEKDIAAAVEITVSAPSTAAQINTVIPTASLKALAKSDVKYLIIDTPMGNITLDSKAMASVAGQAGGSQTTFGISMTTQSALTAAQKEAAGTGLVIDLSITSNNKTISDLGGGTSIVSIPYTLKDGESADGVAVWYLADDGSLTRIENAKYSKGYAVFTLDHFSRYLIGYDPVAGWANPFADVAKTDWFYENVYYAYTKGLFQGTGATTFEPGSPMDRAMLVTVLWRLDGKPAPSAAYSFKDVKAGAWYADAVSWASENKIVEGYSKDQFGTTDQITREQIAAILYRYGKLKGYTLAVGADLSKYTDGGKLASWAAESMSWANAAKIINGRTADTLAPGSSATRAEVAAMIQRFAESVSAAGEQAATTE